LYYFISKKYQISFEPVTFRQKSAWFCLPEIETPQPANIAIISRNQLMTLENGKKLSIMDYFNKEYNYQIKNPDWPLIHCGDPKRTIYLPIELLDLERQVSLDSRVL
jgi:hypothetical protein